MSSTTVTVTNVESLQGAATGLGLGTIPPGTPVGSQVAAFEAQLQLNLTAALEANELPPILPGHRAFGILAPWDATIAGSAPECAVTAIMNDLARWELPADNEAATAMVESITQGIVDNDGIAGTFVGQTPEGPSANLNWVVAYVVAPVLDKPTVEMGIVYVFAAGFAFNAEKREMAAAAVPSV